MSEKKAPLHPIYQTAFERVLQLQAESSITGGGGDLEDIQAAEKELQFKEDVDIPETLIETKIIPINDMNDLASSSVSLTIVRPIGSENDILPGLIFLHGGGWVMGDGFKPSEKIIKDLVIHAHMVVIYVDYSLSPKAKFPKAVEECYSSVIWLHKHANELNMDASKLAIGGDSVGGNLSAAVTIMLGQRGQSNLLKGQILLYPNLATDHQRIEFESYATYGDGDYPLACNDLAFAYELYLDNNNNDSTSTFRMSSSSPDVRWAPLLASLDELKHVPKALILTAECDILRDEGEAYARKLTQTDVVTCCCVRMIGAIHGYISGPLETPQYRHTIHLISDFLNKECFS